MIWAAALSFLGFAHYAFSLNTTTISSNSSSAIVQCRTKLTDFPPEAPLPTITLTGKPKTEDVTIVSTSTPVQTFTPSTIVVNSTFTTKSITSVTGTAVGGIFTVTYTVARTVTKFPTELLVVTETVKKTTTLAATSVAPAPPHFKGVKKTFEDSLHRDPPGPPEHDPKPEPGPEPGPEPEPEPEPKPDPIPSPPSRGPGDEPKPDPPGPTGPPDSEHDSLKVKRDHEGCTDPEHCKFPYEVVCALTPVIVIKETIIPFAPNLTITAVAPESTATVTETLKVTTFIAPTNVSTVKTTISRPSSIFKPTTQTLTTQITTTIALTSPTTMYDICGPANTLGPKLPDSKASVLSSSPVHGLVAGLSSLKVADAYQCCLACATSDDGCLTSSYSIEEGVCLLLEGSDVCENPDFVASKIFWTEVKEVKHPVVLSNGPCGVYVAGDYVEAKGNL